MINAYLFINGVSGPSTSRTDCIDILSYNWGVQNTSTYGAGASGKEAKAGRSHFQPLEISKVIDNTTPWLSKICATGGIMDQVYVLVAKSNGEEQQPYFRIWLKDAMITSMFMVGNNETVNETVRFEFQAVEIAYAAEKDDGELDAAICKGYDLSTLKPDFAAPKGLPK